MKKGFIIFTLSFVFCIVSNAQLLLNVNGDHSQSVIQQYKKNNSDNPYWKFLSNKDSFEGRQRPDFYVTDEEAFTGDRCLKVVLHELSSNPDQVWNVQIFNWTREDTILAKGRYYRCSVKIKPIGDQPLFSNIAVTNLSATAAGYKFNNKMNPGEWNRVGIVIYNERLDVLRMNNQFNHIWNEPALPITFYLDDCRIIESKLADARVEETGDEVIIKSGWHLFPVEVNPEAFTVSADGEEIAAESAEILSDSMSVRIVLKDYIHSDTDSAKISYNSAIAPLQYVVWPNENYNAPTKSMLSFSNEILENYSTVSTGISKEIHSVNKMKVYPVPATDAITIDGVDESGSIQLISISGQIMKTAFCSGDNNLTLPIGDMDEGIYFIRYSNPSGFTEMRKIIKIN